MNQPRMAGLPVPILRAVPANSGDRSPVSPETSVRAGLPAVQWLLLALLAFATGCRTVDGPLPSLAAFIDAEPAAEEPPVPLARLEEALSVVTPPAREHGRSEPVERDGWRREQQPVDGYRWSHDRLKVLPERLRPHLAAAIRSSKPLVSAAAAIGVARQSGGQDAELAKLINNAALPINVRAAAAETLGKSAESPASVERAYARWSKSAAKGYGVQLHAELLLALGRQISPKDDKRFLAAVEKPDRDTQIAEAAFRAWEEAGEGPLPDVARETLRSKHPRLRAAALRALAACEPDRAEDAVMAALADHDWGVRRAAVESLARLDSREAREKLQQLSEAPEEAVRISVVRALAQTGETVALDALALQDKSWRVRHEYAIALAKRQDEAARAAARQLLNDRSLLVQQQVVRSIAKWDVERGGPLLFAALASPNLVVRRQARDSLGRHWPAVQGFDPAVERERRRQRLAELRAEWEREFAGLQDRVQQVSASSKQYVRDLLGRLREAGRAEQRRAARQLATVSREVQLSGEALRELATLPDKVQDPAVAAELIDALLERRSPVAHRRAVRLLVSGTAEEKRKAAAYFARFAVPDDTRFLLARLSSEDAEIRRLALRALVKCGPECPERPVQMLLTDSDPVVRIAAALTLFQLGYESGSAALERFAAGETPGFKRLMITAFVDARNPKLTRVLIRMLDDDRQEVRHEALVALDRLVPETDRPAIAARDAERKRIAAWKRWSGR